MVLWKIENIHWLPTSTPTAFHRSSPPHCPWTASPLVSVIFAWHHPVFTLCDTGSFSSWWTSLFAASFCKWPLLSHHPLLSQNLKCYQNHTRACGWPMAAEVTICRRVPSQSKGTGIHAVGKLGLVFLSWHSGGPLLIFCSNDEVGRRLEEHQPPRQQLGWEVIISSTREGNALSAPSSSKSAH